MLKAVGRKAKSTRFWQVFLSPCVHSSPSHSFNQRQPYIPLSSHPFLLDIFPRPPFLADWLLFFFPRGKVKQHKLFPTSCLVWEAYWGNLGWHAVELRWLCFIIQESGKSEEQIPNCRSVSHTWWFKFCRVAHVWEQDKNEAWKAGRGAARWGISSLCDITKGFFPKQCDCFTSDLGG